MFSKYEKIIDDKINKIAETDIKQLLQEPDTLKKIIQCEAELIAKYGKEKYNEVLTLAVEKSKGGKKKD